MKNKIFKTISILLVVVFAIAGCKSNTKTDDKEKATVDIFQFKVEAKEALEAAADEYMKQNENITINIETVGGGDDYGAALKSRFASGKEPAIFNVGGLQDVYDWKDNLADLSQEPWVKAAFAGTLDSVTVDGKVYGLPFNQEGYGLIYNKAIFEKADIDPATITSFKALEEAVKKLDSMKDELELKAVFAFPAKETWVTGLHLANIQFANEFKSVNEAYEAKTIEMPYADAWKKLLDLQADYAYQPDGTRGSLNSVDYSTQVEEMFSIGRVALIQQGNWAYGSIAGIDEELASNIGLLPLPLEGVNEDSIPVGIPNYWAVNSAKSEAEVAAAKDFLNWLYTSEEGKKRIINDFKFIPAFSGYESEELQPSDPLAKDILKYSNEGKTMPWVFMGYPTGWGMDVLGADIQGYLLGDLSWEDLLKDAKDKWAEGRK
ncbi:ABC transporter substrate-binding protein [Vallitalea guaymasensis]|uniref:ABC transporter substrate-binding protein n=1 Tax=Vallitalea guaymasensis TaxID=1185412 RepID=UPI00272D4FAF|nr:ABC transporter substrate-binding protein [Vallitalea guaymasensis]